MKYDANTVEAYIEMLPSDRQVSFQRLREIVKTMLPPGFEETMAYGMPAYVVPHEIYPPGYHCNPQEALPFISLANQKNFIAFYHMGIYALPELSQWFQSEYRALCGKKADMGKSCIRFRKTAEIPFDLMGRLAAKMSPLEWIRIYEKEIKKNAG